MTKIEGPAPDSDTPGPKLAFSMRFEVECVCGDSYPLELLRWKGERKEVVISGVQLQATATAVLERKPKREELTMVATATAGLVEGNEGRELSSWR